jgi:hypothetical protein
MMTIVARERVSEHDYIEFRLSQSVLHSTAPDSALHVITGFLHRRSMQLNSFGVAFAVKDLCLIRNLLHYRPPQANTNKQTAEAADNQRTRPGEWTNDYPFISVTAVQLRPFFLAR